MYICISKYVCMCVSTISYLLYYWWIRKSSQCLAKYKECYEFLRWFRNCKMYFSFHWSRASEIGFNDRLLYCREKQYILGSLTAGTAVLRTESGSQTRFGSCLAHWAFLPGFLIRKLKASCCLSLGSLVKVNMGLAKGGWGPGHTLTTESHREGLC